MNHRVANGDHGPRLRGFLMHKHYSGASGRPSLRSVLRKTWQRRWCEVVGDELVQYAAVPQRPATRPRRRIPLRGAQINEATAPFEFIVSLRAHCSRPTSSRHGSGGGGGSNASGNVIHFRAPTADEYDRWLVELRSASVVECEAGDSRKLREHGLSESGGEEARSNEHCSGTDTNASRMTDTPDTCGIGDTRVWGSAAYEVEIRAQHLGMQFSGNDYTNPAIDWLQEARLGGAAAQAGITVGSTLLRVNGVDTAGLRRRDIKRFFTSGARPLRLALRRANATSGVAAVERQVPLVATSGSNSAAATMPLSAEASGRKPSTDADKDENFFRHQRVHNSGFTGEEGAGSEQENERQAADGDDTRARKPTQTKRSQPSTHTQLQWATAKHATLLSVTAAFLAIAAFLFVLPDINQLRLHVVYDETVHRYTSAREKLWMILSKPAIGHQPATNVGLTILIFALAVAVCVPALLRLVSRLSSTAPDTSSKAPNYCEPQHQQQQGKHAERAQSPSLRLSPTSRVGGCVKLPSEPPALLDSAYRYKPRHQADAVQKPGLDTAHNSVEEKGDVGDAVGATARVGTEANAHGGSEHAKTASFRAVTERLEDNCQIQCSDEDSHEHNSFDEASVVAQTELGSRSKLRPSRSPPSPPKSGTMVARERLPPPPSRAPPVRTCTQTPESASTAAAVGATSTAVKAHPPSRAPPLPPSPTRAPPTLPAVPHAGRQRNSIPSVAAQPRSSRASLSITEQADVHLIEMARSSARAREVMARLRASLSARGSNADGQIRANSCSFSSAGARLGGRVSVPHSASRHLLSARKGEAAPFSASPLQSAVAARAAAEEASSVAVQAVTASQLAVRMASAAAQASSFS